MAVEIVRLTGEDAFYVALNMRQNDAREIYATRWDESAWSFASDCIRLPGISWCALLDGEPVVIGGIANHHPGVGQAWMVGTDKLPRAAITLTRFCKDIVTRMLSEDSGINRIQAMSAEFHKEAHAWLRAVGLNATTALPQYGKGGEDFTIFYGLREIKLCV